MFRAIRALCRQRKPLHAAAVAACFVMVIVGAALFSSATARACSTPVYRYAMYNWAPGPFFVFYFHHGQPTEEDKKVNQMIADLSRTGPALANVVFEAVDLSQKGLERIPTPVRKAWESHAGTDAQKAKPMHIVFTSWGVETFAGRLDAATLRAMVDSPARKKICELLHGGNGTVMVLLPGSDAAENNRAEKVIQEVIAGVASSSILVDPDVEDFGYYEPMPAAEKPGGDTSDGDAASEDAKPSEDDAATKEEPNKPKNRLKVGFLKLSRSEAAEKWFVDALMKMEPDLAELAKEPMVFAFYGRGRAMWPYVGKGITAENLIELLQFLGGPCSCQVKEQNPGLDLLMHWDWDATAEAMAATDPAYGGGPYGYQEFSPDDAAQPGSSETEAGSDESKTGEGRADSESEKATAESPTEKEGVQAETEEAAVQSDTGAEGVELASAAGGSPSEAAKSASAEVDRGRDTEPSQPASEDAPPTTGPDPQQGADAEALTAARRDESVARSTVEGPGPHEEGSFVRRQLWTLGIGFAVAMAVVLVVGLVLIRARTNT